MRYMCPVTWFLSLAFADNVFQDLSSHEDLAKARPPAGSFLFRARYNKDALDRPIMRNTRADGTLSADRIWTYDCFNTALRGVGQRAGYKENLSAYCFRRAFAHAVQSQSNLLRRGSDMLIIFRESDCTTTSNAIGPQRRRNRAILRLRLCWNR